LQINCTVKLRYKILMNIFLFTFRESHAHFRKSANSPNGLISMLRISNKIELKNTQNSAKDFLLILKYIHGLTLGFE